MQRFGGERRVIVHGEHDEAHAGNPRVNSAQGVESAQSWHRDVAEHGIWTESERGLDESFAVAHTANDVEFRLEEPSKGFQQ